jgi:AbrB family looped-hinge helix DNA binding protein
MYKMPGEYSHFLSRYIFEVQIMKIVENLASHAFITRNGQVKIPLKILRCLGLKSGSQITIYEQDGEIRLIPLTAKTIDKNFGILKSGKGSMTKVLLEERRQECKREDRKASGPLCFDITRREANMETREK